MGNFMIGNFYPPFLGRVDKIYCGNSLCWPKVTKAQQKITLYLYDYFDSTEPLATQVVDMNDSWSYSGLFWETLWNNKTMYYTVGCQADLTNHVMNFTGIYSTYPADGYSRRYIKVGDEYYFLDNSPVKFYLHEIPEPPRYKDVTVTLRLRPYEGVYTTKYTATKHLDREAEEGVVYEKDDYTYCVNHNGKAYIYVNYEEMDASIDRYEASDTAFDVQWGYGSLSCDRFNEAESYSVTYYLTEYRIVDKRHVILYNNPTSKRVLHDEYLYAADLSADTYEGFNYRGKNWVVYKDKQLYTLEYNNEYKVTLWPPIIKQRHNGNWDFYDDYDIIMYDYSGYMSDVTVKIYVDDATEPIYTKVKTASSSMLDDEIYEEDEYVHLVNKNGFVRVVVNDEAFNSFLTKIDKISRYDVREKCALIDKKYMNYNREVEVDFYVETIHPMTINYYEDTTKRTLIGTYETDNAAMHSVMYYGGSYVPTFDGETPITFTFDNWHQNNKFTAYYKYNEYLYGVGLGKINGFDIKDYDSQDASKMSFSKDVLDIYRDPTPYKRDFRIDATLQHLPHEDVWDELFTEYITLDSTIPVDTKYGECDSLYCINKMIDDKLCGCFVVNNDFYDADFLCNYDTAGSWSKSWHGVADESMYYIYYEDLIYKEPTTAAIKLAPRHPIPHDWDELKKLGPMWPMKVRIEGHPETEISFNGVWGWPILEQKNMCDFLNSWTPSDVDGSGVMTVEQQVRNRVVNHHENFYSKITAPNFAGLPGDDEAGYLYYYFCPLPGTDRYHEGFLGAIWGDKNWDQKDEPLYYLWPPRIIKPTDFFNYDGNPVDFTLNGTWEILE